MFKHFLEKKHKSKFTFDKILNDIENIEEKRQYIQQLIVYISCNNRLFISNIDEILNNDQQKLILDVGSGYNIWTKEFANRFINLNNNCFICNIDIRKYTEVYESLYLKMDLKNNIKFCDETIHFIYHRDMITVYSVNEWNHIISEMYRVLKYDFYAELVEYDFIVRHNSNNDSFYSNIINQYLISLFKKSNYEYNIQNIFMKVKQYFKKVENNKIKLPLYYESEYENICVKNLIMGYTHFKDDLNNTLKNYNLDFNKFIILLENEWKKNYAYMELHIIIGHK